MTSASPNVQVGGKSINTPSYSSSLQSLHVSSPNFENNRRSSSQSSSQAIVHSSARKNQSNRKPHRNQRKPRLGTGWGDEDEAGTMRNANSRRGQTDITHLMNFSLPPRPQYNQSSSRGTRRNPTYGLGSGHHSIDKARYVHANYRFIVDPTGNYHQNAIDTDIHLDWNNVLQILASAESQASSCPICLSPPVAPRMAKCGHIFCLPCLIRYMHSTDETNPVPEKKARWKKCPICWDTIYISDTRPLRWYTGQENPAPKEGEDVVLRLVMRQPGSTLALPRDGAEALAKSEDVPWYFAAEVTDYARVMKGSEDYMIEQFDGEIESLLLQEKEDELMFGEETQWTKKAVNAINDAKEKAKGIGNPPALPAEPVERKPKREPIQFNESDVNVPEMYLIQHAVKSGQSKSDIRTIPDATEQKTCDGKLETEQHPGSEKSSNLNPASTSLRARPRGADTGHQDSPFYFYQALTHYYLSPLDIRILKTAFGNFASFPSTILPRVEHVSTGHIVDDDLRRRTKYLGHLPYGCEVGFLECDWTDVVGPEVLEQFSSEIEKRRKRNHEKETREEKDRIRAERLEDEERWASARRKHPTAQDEKLLGPDDFLPLASSSLDMANSPPWGNRAGSSFATLASPSTSPEGPKTVWGTSIVAAASPDLVAQQHVEPDADDGWLQDWEKELQAENDIIAQVQAASLNENGGSGSGGGGGGGSKGGGQGKKKKGKKITLMSTTARRAA